MVRQLGTSIGVVLALLLIAGCAVRDVKTGEKLHCRQPGSEFDMRCARPKPRSTEDMVLICEQRGISRDDARDCRYVTRGELDRIMREIQGQR